MSAAWYSNSIVDKHTGMMRGRGKGVTPHISRRYMIVDDGGKVIQGHCSDARAGRALRDSLHRAGRTVYLLSPEEAVIWQRQQEGT